METRRKDKEESGFLTPRDPPIEGGRWKGKTGKSSKEKYNFPISEVQGRKVEVRSEGKG